MQIINKIVWSIAIILIFSNSIYFSVKLKFPQIKLIKIFSSLKNNKKETGISSKDTLIMSLASKIGAGSLAGIAFAIYYGGIGTIFWMWVSSFFVSINCYLENILSTIYKEKDHENCKGGPAYYIKKGLNNKNLSIIYCILAIITYNLGFTSIQNNTITTLITNVYPVNKIVISLIIAILTALVIIKGINKISNICNKIVPIMTITYLTLGIIVIILNISKIPTFLIAIIKEAFYPKAIKSGLIYTFIIGIQKGIFANEAGVGTSAIISGSTNNKDYIKQGNIGIIETYFISLFITTVTSIIVISSNYKLISFNNINGIELVKYAFNYHFGHFGEIILIIILLLFSFSTIITVYYYGESNLKFLSNKNSYIKILKIITIIILFFGGIIPSLKVWNVVDTLVAILAIINISSIYKMKKKLKDVIIK